MPVRTDEAWSIIRFGSDQTAAVEVRDSKNVPRICLSNRPPFSISWNLLDAEVYVFSRIKVAHDQGLAWSVRHWMGNAQWRERKALYEEVYQRLGLQGSTDPWEVGARIYRDLQEQAGVDPDND